MDTDGFPPEVAPPQYMLDLYHSVADPHGITRAPNPYNSNVIRSFRHQPGNGYYPSSLYFNITDLEEGESIVEAELHIYRIKSHVKHWHKRYHLQQVCRKPLLQFWARKINSSAYFI